MKSVRIKDLKDLAEDNLISYLEMYEVYNELKHYVRFSISIRNIVRTHKKTKK